MFFHTLKILVGFHPAHQKISASHIFAAVSCQEGIWKADVCILEVFFFFLIDNAVIRKLWASPTGITPL